MEFCPAVSQSPVCVPQSSELGSVQCNTFINDLDYEIECTLNQFADENKFGRSVDLFRSRKTLQKDLERLDQWTEASDVRFNMVKCQVPHLGQNNPRQHYRPGAEWLERCPAEKNMGVLLDSS
ncbi:hypothetical protein WISP_134847 [Willisornis vidua]|uniref:Rna-directed dna polymerase from mobile element jockey-like n=1 Tax=Willisornis vidua TaxID=1566151 RepID=A0ABQ9CNQ6_9PASS|nr:hypothetical protein WISP_134847 [Willisornis vidua]